MPNKMKGLWSPSSERCSGLFSASLSPRETRKQRTQSPPYDLVLVSSNDSGVSHHDPSAASAEHQESCGKDRIFFGPKESSTPLRRYDTIRDHQASITTEAPAVLPEARPTSRDELAVAVQASDMAGEVKVALLRLLFPVVPELN
jgi:hypothetical protein